jgi:hypothetical protein
MAKTVAEWITAAQSIVDKRIFSPAELHQVAQGFPPEAALFLLREAHANVAPDDTDTRSVIVTALEAAVEYVRRNERVDHAYKLLLERRYQEGFNEYEQRIGGNDCELFYPDKPAWRPDMKGARIIVTGEQGRGDQIMMVRFLDWEIFKGNRIFVECHAALQPLFARLPFLERVFPFDDELSLKERRDSLPLGADDIDFEIPFMSLAHVVGADYSPKLYRGPYLIADSNQNRWPERLQNERFKVGLVWQAGQLTDRCRSIPLELLRPLLGVEDVAFFSLVVKPEERRKLQEAGGDFCKVLDLGVYLTDFDQTASAIANLDLTISVDTATVHLAGSLHKKVWVPLPRPFEWRWGLDGESTFWYPSMDLVRQDKPDEWEPVIVSLREMLVRRVAEWRARR